MDLASAIASHFERTEAWAAAAAAAAASAGTNMELEEDQQQPQPGCLTVTHRYKVKDAFSEKDLYWINNVRVARFEETIGEGGILYRPEIVDDLLSNIQKVLRAPVGKGIMVKGPQGIGKSHSLVNLVRKLLYGCNNRYLVTFIPNCDLWYNVSNLSDDICASFGTTRQAIQFQTTGNNALDHDALSALINTVNSELDAKGKQWVFIFDQINKLFVKHENIHAKGISGLHFPFYMIASVMKPGRITSIISASANNELAYKESHEGFDEYNHKNNMTENELCLAFDRINYQNVQDILENSDGVPLYALLYIHDSGKFQDEINESVDHSLKGLRQFDKDDWELVKQSIFSSLLGTATHARKYDKKFLIRQRLHEGLWQYRPLFPAVLSAYRSILWNELMKYVQNKEKDLLEICRASDTTNDTRGRLFEAIVIRRCQTMGVKIQVGDDQVMIDPSSEFFPTKRLPSLDAYSKDGVYIPFDSCFPAIDLVWKHGKCIYGVQVHVSSHKDVASTFWGLCKQAGWFQTFNKVHLLYLSPENRVTHLVSQLVEPPTFEGTMSRSAKTSMKFCISRSATSKNSVFCLRELHWPMGCSL